MLQFIARRLFFILAVSLAVIFFVFLGMGMADNSEVPTPSYDLLAQGQDAWEDTQFFLADLLRGEWGTFSLSPDQQLPVSELLTDAYHNSIVLLLLALLAASLVGLVLGGIAALREGTSLSLLTATTLGISVPSFFMALLLQHWVIRAQDAVGQRWLSVGGFGWDVDHMLLPVLVLAARPVAYLARATFIGLTHVMTQDYIRTANAKGLRQQRIVLVHALRNVAVPVLTAVGVSLRFSLGALPIVEYFFAWPGLGMRLIEAINTRQTEVVVALALVLGLTLLLVNLALDVVYRVADPRLREAA